MSQFRKKPVMIEAEQFFIDKTPLPFSGNGNPVMFGCECGPKEACSRCGKFYIETLEGPMILTDKDWVIRGIKGEYYPCKPEIFAATYDPVEAQP